MAKQLLIETRMNSLSLCEGVQSKHPGCLGTISGPCADFVNPTRNNNFYSRKLWENVFKDPLVTECLEDRVLIGELDHPGDRLETKATNAAIVMTGYSFDDANGTVNGTFDILDTPNGRILESLLKYGCKIGVSSRGEGDVTTKDGVDTVNEESYYFVGFDAVVLPAVKKAKPALQESLKRESLRDSIKTQIESATSKAELDMIKKVIEATKLPELDSLIESINIKSKDFEGTNSSSNLMEDLETSAHTIQRLREENKQLRQEVANGKSRIQRYINSQHMLTGKKSKLSEDLKASISESSDLRSQLELSSRKVRTLESKLSESTATIEDLKEELRTTRSKLTECEAQISSLEESLNRSQDTSRRKGKIVEGLRKELAESKASYEKQLSEAQSELTKVKAQVRKYKSDLSEATKVNQETLQRYASKRSRECSIDSKRVLESMKSATSISEIDSLIEEEVARSDRYRKLPTTEDSLIESLSSSSGKVSISTTKPDSVMTQAKSFMEQVYNMKG